MSSSFAKDEKQQSRKIAEAVKIQLTDKVYRLVDQEDAKKIMFSTHAGIYYLKKNTQNYDLVLKVLEESLAQGEEISLKVDATTLEIEEVILKTN